MAEAAVTQVQCGFCLRKDGALEDPRSLPCTHIHCLRCLTDNYNINGIVRCPLCREVFDVTLESLPSSNTREDKSTSCDSCTKKGVDNQPAVTYCTFCAAKYCKKHQESHDDIHGDHAMISIDEYKLQARKLQPRLCTEHKELPYSMGCRSCLVVICVECITELESCKDGAAHKWMPLNKLVAELTNEINEMRAEVIDREDKLSALFKQTSRIISEYDSETKDMIGTLHKTRDDQLEAINLKYRKLEEELLELRRNVKSDMTRFMEENVGVKWSDLSKHRLQIEARLKHNHQVDIVNGYEEITNAIKKLILDELPTLELQNMMTLEVKDQTRDVEVEVIFPKYGFIDLEHGLTTADPLPKSMSLLQTVQVSKHCRLVCHYQGNTYVGLDNKTVEKIDENYQLSKSFLTLSSYVEGVTVYKDKVYTLVYGKPHAVNVHDLTGKLITSWTHTGGSSIYNKLAIVDNQIIIPDLQSKRLTIYSLTGEIVKHLPCSLRSNSYVAICAADDHSVVVSDYASSQVFKVNISTGEVSWTSTHVTNPQGVTCYRSKAFVTNKSSTTRVWILDVKTGDLLTEISDPAVRCDSNVFDLYVSEKTLIVPRYDESKVLFYQLD